MNNSVYIHIPFCDNICTYCDFCKRLTNNDLASKYLDCLEKEIKEKYKNDLIKTIYIGGGTPSSLNINNLKKLFNIIKYFKKDKNLEFTMEINPENITYEKLVLMKENQVNRISIGVESTKDKYLKYLGRKHNYQMVKDKIKLMKEIGFDNINVDLIYAIPNQTISDLKDDLDNILNLDITHISTYSLMINNNTILGIKKEKNIDDMQDNRMYNFICSYLKKHGFIHYEISNFSKKNYQSKHNLVYWHNEGYYGFGIGASGYIDDYRYDNTKSMVNYLKGNYTYNMEYLTINDKISYELILGFRLIKGINKKEFYQKYNKNLIDIPKVRDLIKEKLLIENGRYIKVRYDKIYIENSILINFV